MSGSKDHGHGVHQRPVRAVNPRTHHGNSYNMPTTKKANRIPPAQQPLFGRAHGKSEAVKADQDGE